MIMRIQCENYAYEVTQVRDPRTQVFTHWEFKVYQIRPYEVLVASGKDSPSRGHAERSAKQMIACFTELDKGNPRKEESRRVA